MAINRRALALTLAGALGMVLAPGALRAQDAAKKNPVVVMETSLGAVTLELNPAKAPVTVKNFLAYVEKGHYNGTIFHRVISDFMIQGGGFTPEMEQKPTDAPVKNEAKNGLKNERGTIAMARTSNPDSATSQFFINTVDNTENLGPGGVDPYGYTVFGKVTKGMDVVDKIRKVKTGNVGFYENVPLEPVVIKSIKLQK